MADTISARSISLDGARRVLEAAIAEAERLRLAVCISVCGQDGEAKIAACMDGAPKLSAVLAADKAWSVIAWGGMPTSRWWQMVKDDPALMHGFTKQPRLVVIAGGVPLRARMEVVGAVGVSGGSPEQDELVAEAGAAELSPPS
jgi:glc operon protein GlcG